ncbi:MAG TPA: ABC-2 family transporter protein [Symbiobacteriaceae bacterium]|nr:ABC-2 family transporter protein [Symbiobacteriaceae bacterium]
MKLSLAWAFLLQHIKTHLEYRVNFLISAGGTAVWQLACLLAVQVVLDRTTDLGGWSKHEIFLIYGVITLIMAVPRMFAFNLFFLGGQYIRPGTFDRLLVRPLNPLCHLLADRFSPEGVGDFAVGVYIVARAFGNLGIRPSPAMLLYLTLMVLSGAMVVIAINLFLSTTAFWTQDSAPLMLAANHNTQMARYPLTIYTKPIRIALTWVLPYGLISFYPAAHLLGRVTGWMAYASIPVAALLFAGAYRFWLFGLRHYTGTGS